MGRLAIDVPFRVDLVLELDDLDKAGHARLFQGLTHVIDVLGRDEKGHATTCLKTAGDWTYATRTSRTAQRGVKGHAFGASLNEYVVRLLSHNNLKMWADAV